MAITFTIPGILISAFLILAFQAQQGHAIPQGVWPRAKGSFNGSSYLIPTGIMTGSGSPSASAFVIRDVLDFQHRQRRDLSGSAPMVTATGGPTATGSYGSVGTAASTGVAGVPRSDWAPSYDFEWKKEKRSPKAAAVAEAAPEAAPALARRAFEGPLKAKRFAAYFPYYQGEGVAYPTSAGASTGFPTGASTGTGTGILSYPSGTGFPVGPTGTGY